MSSEQSGSARTGQLVWHRFDELPLDAILLAAADAFTEQGYHGASVRDIALRVGVTVPTLYYHYGSKQGLLVSLLNASMGDLVARSAAALESAGDQPLHRLVDLIDCTCRFMCHRRQIALLDTEARYLDEAARVPYVALRRQFEDRLLDVLRDGADAGIFEIEHPVDVNRALLGAYQSIALWYRSDGPLSPEEIAERHVAFSLDAVRVDRRRRTAGLRRVQARRDELSHAS